MKMLKYITVFFFLSPFLYSEIEKSETMKMLNITVVGYLLVMVSLVFIYFFVATMSKSLAFMEEMKTKRRLKKKEHHMHIKDRYGRKATPETVAAIMMAIHINAEMQKEEEQAILTIGKIIRPYSPWSSKIYNMRNQPWATLKK